MTHAPIILKPEELNDYLARFADDGSGLTVTEIVELFSHLLHTGSIKFVSTETQEIVGSFISAGVLDFEGNITIPEELDISLD